MSFKLLDGYRIIDMSQYAPGPYCSLLLADMGAEVFKVEPPGGEPMRRVGPIESDGISAWCNGLVGYIACHCGSLGIRTVRQPSSQLHGPTPPY